MWFLKVVGQALVVASAFFMVAWLRWIPGQVFFLAFVLYVLFFVVRNPDLMFRRTFQALVIAAIAPVGFSARASGQADLPNEFGPVQYLIEIGNTTPTGVWLGLAALCVIGDLVLVKRGREGREKLYNAPTQQADLLKTKKGAIIRVSTALRPAASVDIRGARLRVLHVIPWDLRCWVEIQLSPLQAAEEISPDAPRTISVPAGTNAEITIKAPVPASARGRRLLWRARWTFFGLMPLAGVVTFDAAPPAKPLPISVEPRSPEIR